MNPFYWFDESMALRLVQALSHFLWQGCAVALVVMLAGRTLKRASAQVRYAFDVAALVVMAGCLPVTFALVAVPGSGEPGPRSSALRTAGRSDADSPQEALEARAVVDQGPQAVTSSLPRRVGWWPSWAGRTWSWLAPFAPSVMAGYFLGVALMTLRLILALQGGRQLTRSAVPVEDEPLLTLIGLEIRRMGIKVAPAVAFCERISVPIVVGLLRPVILLPAALASGLSPDQLQALLAHELAHIRRFDLVVNLVQRLAEAVLFFHPAVWFVSHRISTERELAADDLVLAAGWQRVHYADALVRMAELSWALRRTRIGESGVGLAAWGADESEFKRRVLRLLARDDRPMLRLSRAGWSFFLSVLILVALTPLLVQAWAPAASPPQAEAKDASRPQSAAQSEVSQPKAESPNVILSKHVILWGDEIVTWDEVVKRLRTIVCVR
ncbi:BlaR1 peptidase M56 [Singulisphaera sp. GP187]|uniref:M56 family metallopeptidase n=1 Tax=Singulisphaera sp. GP187 TaxID=1882752 RepID=UPI00092BDFE8|nr:M56 family metallopeptidase [Singulisphaera sp. GP187]SIO55841.1 BlaR1 peptidase M56 [Singulisphaera sp. GP187]